MNWFQGKGGRLQTSGLRIQLAKASLRETMDVSLRLYQTIHFSRK
jgi:hypothetical protein